MLHFLCNNVCSVTLAKMFHLGYFVPVLSFSELSKTTKFIFSEILITRYLLKAVIFKCELVPGVLILPVSQDEVC